MNFFMNQHLLWLCKLFFSTTYHKKTYFSCMKFSGTCTNYDCETYVLYSLKYFSGCPLFTNMPCSLILLSDRSTKSAGHFFIEEDYCDWSNPVMCPQYQTIRMLIPIHTNLLWFPKFHRGFSILAKYYNSLIWQPLLANFLFRHTKARGRGKFKRPPLIPKVALYTKFLPC